MKKILLNSHEASVLEAALNQRIEYFSDLLENNEGFGFGIEELYKSELKDAKYLLERIKEV